MRCPGCGGVGVWFENPESLLRLWGQRVWPGRRIFDDFGILCNTARPRTHPGLSLRCKYDTISTSCTSYVQTISSVSFLTPHMGGSCMGRRTCRCACACLSLSLSRSLSLCLRLCVSTYTHMCVCVRVYMYMYMYMYMYIYICIIIYMYIFAYKKTFRYADVTWTGLASAEIG